MCGRYGFTKKSDLKRRYDLAYDDEILEWRESYNIAPTQPAVIITKNSPNAAHIRKFGIKAPWKESMLLINAQSETVIEKRTYKTMFRESRCLIPADFFYEWKKTTDGKQPYAFSLQDEGIMSFAGIYNDEGFVILTGKPNELMKDVHDRHPIILRKEDEETWLNLDTDEDQLMNLLRPYPASEMKKWEVSTAVNSPRNNSSEIIRPVA